MNETTCDCTYPLSVTRGRSMIFSFDASSEDDGEQFVFTTGDILRFGVKKRYLDSKCLIVKTAQISEPSNTVSFYLSPDDTVNLAIGDYYYDIGLERGTEYYDVIKCSAFTVLPNVTRKEQ